VPADALDARSRALGVVGIGQPGWYLLATDPGAAAGIALPTISASYQPTRAELDNGRSAGHARFPTVSVSYPLWGNVFSVGFASAFDQEWEVVAGRIIDLNGTEVPAIDAYRSSGDLSRVHVGWARRVAETVGVGMTIGGYVGSSERTFSRLLDSGAAGEGVEIFATQGRWRASGLVIGGGATWDPTSFLRVAGAFVWSDGLNFSPSTTLTTEERSYSIPLELRAGATATLAPGLGVSAGVVYADWSTVGEELGAGTARAATWSYGGGLEWARATLFGRAFPLRVGVRHQDLPFFFEGMPAQERTISGGFGFELVESEGQPIARLDFGLERGSRTAGAHSERFLRSTLSLRLAGG